MLWRIVDTLVGSAEAAAETQRRQQFRSDIENGCIDKKPKRNIVQGISVVGFEDFVVAGLAEKSTCCLNHQLVSLCFANKKKIMMKC